MRQRDDESGVFQAELPTQALERWVERVETGPLGTEASVLVTPVRVQGEGAAEQIAWALRRLNNVAGIDAVILGRGGGSNEDLAALNTECVAQAIFESVKPVISAVGHEIDVTPGTERPSGPGDHHHPTSLVPLGRAQRGQQVLTHRPAERVQLLGPVEGDGGDGVGGSRAVPLAAGQVHGLANKASSDGLPRSFLLPVSGKRPVAAGASAAMSIVHPQDARRNPRMLFWG